MNRIYSVGIVLIASLLFAQIVAAEERNPDDQVVLNLTSEGWVTTDTAVVHVTAEAIQQSETANELKKLITSSLDKLSDKSEWHFTNFSQSRDKTGLNRWRADAQARLPETALSSLRDKAKEISRPGFRLSIGHVDFSPSLAEFEKARHNLRKQLYGRIKAELEMLNSASSDRNYRLKDAFFGQPHAQPVMRQERASKMRMSAVRADASQAGNVGVARKLSLTVSVTFGAETPEGKDD